MRKVWERDELIDAVTERGERVAVAAARLGVSESAAYGWVRAATEASARRASPRFVELVPARATSMVVRVGAVEIEVRMGFDGELLRAVVAALGGDDA